MKITRKRRQSIITTICIGLAFIAVGLTIMFAVLRPQDQYKKIDGVVLEAYPMGGNTCIVEVEYNVDGIKYTTKFNAFFEYSKTEKIAIRYKVDNPNKTRLRFYTVYMSLTVELIFIGLTALTSLITVKQKLSYKSETEYKRDKLIYYIFVFSTLALLVLIPLIGIFSQLFYY